MRNLCRTHVLQVREAKGVIEASNAEFPAAQLKLIHSGKILKDESTLEEYQIKEDDFLVCMVTKVQSIKKISPFYFDIFASASLKL